MLIRSNDNGFQHPQGSEITPQAAYLRRRAWLQYLAAGSAAAALPAWAAGVPRPGKLAALASVPSQVAGANSMERVTPYADASQYNNFYEFGLDKDDPAKNAHTLRTRPWAVKIEGLVQQPQTLDLDALLKLAPQEERIYRLRCVEGWSMVIPWVGYSLAELLRKVQPLGSAKYVEFVTLADKAQTAVGGG
jgi:sulfoxide reductase catalytic subunit YedY